MAKKMISPGIFTFENDLSYVARGISEIGSAFIGRTKQGPAFEPTIISDYNDFYSTFGGKDVNMPVGYAVYNYMKNSGTSTIVRTLGQSTLDYGSAGEIYADSTLMAVLKASKLGKTGAEDITFAITEAGTVNSFFLEVGASGSAAVTYSASLNPTDDNFLGNLFSENPKTENTAVYLDTYYSSSIATNLATAVSATDSELVSGSSVEITTDGYRNAYSPKIVSQEFSSTTHDLFQFTSLKSGDASNQEIKLAIFNIVPATSVANSEYGTFGLSVRKYSDKDNKQIVLETFSNLTLDPNSSNYIARRIGDQYKTVASGGKITIHGDYENISKYVRITMLSTTYPKAAIPWGFTTYYKYNSSTASIPVKTTQLNTSGEYSTSVYFGVDFTNNDVDNYHMAMPSSKVSATDFTLTNCTSNGVAVTTASSSTAKQFIFGLQDGTDAYDPREDYADQYTFTTYLSSGSVDWRYAIDTLSNPDEYDFNMMVMPDVHFGNASNVINYAIDLAESRTDFFVLADLGAKADSIATQVARADTIDTSYAASYYPYVKFYDSENNRNLWLAPSVALSGVISFSDSISFEWYVPAGFTRGGMNDALQTYDRLNRDDRDTLYAGKINPIASFANEGIVVWGQKTLQTDASATNRLNVRRLLIKIEKTIASVAKYFVFDQSNESTWTRFKQKVQPILNEVLANNGIEKFNVVCDSSNNTADKLNANIMVADIYVQPTRAAEFIQLNFNIEPTGVTTVSS